MGEFSPGDRVQVVAGVHEGRTGVVLDPARPGDDSPGVWVRLDHNTMIYLVHESALEAING